uniref:FZ domain-containing protein n=1 Tax=Romanomermis culicivorax TaxID=13658 RepID=A0A915IIJ8_ROMCU
MQKIRSLTFLAIVVYSSCLNNNYANRLSSSDEAIFDSSIYVSDDSSAAAAAASSSWPLLGAGAGSKMGQAAACVSIPRNFSLCHGIDYDKMRLPNLLEHETLDEAVQQSTPWVSLLRLNCHTEAKLFLCSLFAPVCLERAIYPCRSLCETVKTGCEKRMQAYGFPWPDMLNCAKFPVTNDMCIQPRENYQGKMKKCKVKEM